MRVLIDARVINPDAHHGIARHASGLLAELVEEPGGHDYLLLIGRREWAGSAAEHPAFEIRECALIPYTPAEVLRLPGLIAKERVDLYYSPTFIPPVWGATPVAVTIHDLIHLDYAKDYPLSRWLAWRLIIAPGLKRARRVLTCSRTTAERLIGELGVEPERLAVVGNGVDGVFRPRPDSEVAAVRRRLDLTGPYLVACGNPRPHKNLLTAVRAFHRLVGLGFDGSLVLIGAEGLNLPRGRGRLIRAQGLSDDEMAALYTGAAGMVFPSLAEGFGLPPLEAMACGCPVLASDIPVLREILGRAADYAPAGDVVALAEAMERLIGEPEAAGARAEAGLKRAAEYTWRWAGDNLRRVFDELEVELGGRREP